MNFLSALLITLQILQWTGVLYDLYHGDFKKKSEFLIKSIPGFFIITIARYSRTLYMKYLDLE